MIDPIQITILLGIIAVLLIALGFTVGFAVAGYCHSPTDESPGLEDDDDAHNGNPRDIQPAVAALPGLPPSVFGWRRAPTKEGTTPATDMETIWRALRS